MFNEPKNYREVGFMTPVKVDGVFFPTMKSGTGGIQKILETANGVRIVWNFGTVFVPSNNVAWIDERN